MELFAPLRAIPGMITPRRHAAVETDAEAIGRSVAEPSAFEVVFDRHFEAVYAYAQRRVGAGLAEEVAAETFLRALEARASYDTAYVEALPWLLGIASNIMRRHWRSERRRLAAYARAASHDLPAEGTTDDGDILVAVARLPRRQREVLLLAAWADLTYEQIARALNLPIGTVRSRLARARGRLGADVAFAASRPLTRLDDVKETPCV
jgi:RNA polymerase sigma-70 factor (ECF subfamily)